MHQTARKITGIIGAAAAVLFMMPFAASALTISPPVFDYDLNPGDAVLDVIRVHNEAETAQTFYPHLVDFVADDAEDGIPRFVPAGQDISGSGLADWITVDKTGLSTPSQGRTNIPFSVNVPANAQPGGHYGAILLSTVPPSDVPGGVGISAQLAVLILVNVSGEVREVGSIAEFGFHDSQVWYDSLPVDFFMRFENGGNTHLRPTGELFIKDWMGRQVAVVEVNGGDNSVLPMSIRRFVFGWHKAGSREGDSSLVRELKNFAIGRHTATLVVQYGRTTGRTLSEERVFYVWPWRSMIAGGVTLLLLVALWRARRKMLAKSIIRRYEEAKRKEVAMKKT